jgi:hypothetical protein
MHFVNTHWQHLLCSNPFARSYSSLFSPHYETLNRTTFSKLLPLCTFIILLATMQE